MAIVKYLCEHNANANILFKGGYSPLFVAAEKGRVPIVKYLLNYGAEVDLIGDERSTPRAPIFDPQKRMLTVFAKVYVASQNGNLEVVEILVQQVRLFARVTRIAR